MIVFAMNQDGELYSVSDPDCPSSGRCPICGAKLYLKSSALGNLFFALYPGHSHQYRECRELDGSRIIRDIQLTSATDFLAGILDEIKKVKKIEENPKKDGNVRGPRNLTETKIPLRAMKDLWRCGLTRSSNRPLGQGWLSDIIINPCYAYMLLGHCSDLGPRVLQGVPEYVFPSRQVIRFLSFISRDIIGAQMYGYVVLDVHISNEEEFDRLSRLLFASTMDATSKVKIEAKRRDTVLIAGNWKRLGRNECSKYCQRRCDSKWVCKGYYYTEAGQIFCPPTTMTPTFRKENE